MLVTRAFNIQPYQLSVPLGLEAQRFDINARVPQGATRKDFRAMLGRMLAERFAMQSHTEQREMLLYELKPAKGGYRLKAAASSGVPGPEAPARSQAAIKYGADGFPILPGAPPIINSNGRTRLQLLGASIEEFTRLLSLQLGRPVIDATNLAGKYDIVLYWDAPGTGLALPKPPEAADQGGAEAPVMEPIARVVERELGLKLDKKRGSVETVIVDHINKLPALN